MVVYELNVRTVQSSAVLLTNWELRPSPIAAVRFYTLLLMLQVMKQMAMHPLTDKGLQAFVDDWEKAKAQQKNAL